jgi:DNA-binding PucR family transcriptional regulator
VGLISMGTTPQLGRVVELLTAEAGGAVGMSDPFHEISSAPEALRQARIAMAAGLGAVPGVTAYSDVPLQAMLVLAPQSAEQLRRAVLGPLLDAPRGDSAVLMDTLQSWILAGGSATDCANRMYVHRNSVTRRLQRIFELTGCDPRTPRGMGMLYVAAEAHRLTPSLPAGAKPLGGGIGGLASPGALRRRRASR